MPAYSRALNLRHAALAALALAAGCSDPQQGGSFEVDGIEAHWSNGRIDVRIDQRLVLSGEAQRALEHGVPLTIGMDLVLRDATTRTRVDRRKRQYEIRYLPLSERYQLTRLESGDVQTYPRLRHALAELGRLRLSYETGVLPGGEYEMLARSFLDKRAMPPPMRLPVMFSQAWKHDSDWTSRPLTIEPEA